MQIKTLRAMGSCFPSYLYPSTYKPGVPQLCTYAAMPPVLPAGVHWFVTSLGSPGDWAGPGGVTSNLQVLGILSRRTGSAATLPLSHTRYASNNPDSGKTIRHGTWYVCRCELPFDTPVCRVVCRPKHRAFFPRSTGARKPF